MLINHQSKIIFIAVPKTGTTAFESYLLNGQFGFSRDPKGLCDESMIHTHMSILEWQDILGENFNNWKFFAFVRDPIDCIRSKYAFYTEGRAFVRLKQNHPEMQKFSKKVRSYFALLTPYWLWSIIYPLRINLKYIAIKNKIPENLTVAKFEDDSAKKTELLMRMGINIDFSDIPVKNKTVKTNKHNLHIFIMKIVMYKIRKEQVFYDSI